jgi:hypothetical protein
MAERFTLQRPKLPPSMYEGLPTTIPIESPESGVARRTANVRYRRDQGMVERWVVSAWVLSRKTVSEKIPVVVTCGRWPRFSDAKPRLKSCKRK